MPTKKLKSLIFYCLAAFYFSPHIFAGTLPQSREGNLFHILQNLPSEGVSAHRVAKLVKTLVKLAPFKAYKYYRVGKKHLSRNSDTVKLKVMTILTLRKSDLTKEQINAIEKRFDKDDI